MALGREVISVIPRDDPFVCPLNAVELWHDCVIANVDVFITDSEYLDHHLVPSR